MDLRTIRHFADFKIWLLQTPVWDAVLIHANSGSLFRCAISGRATVASAVQRQLFCRGLGRGTFCRFGFCGHTDVTSLALSNQQSALSQPYSTAGRELRQGGEIRILWPYRRYHLAFNAQRQTSACAPSSSFGSSHQLKRIAQCSAGGSVIEDAPYGDMF